MKKEIEITVPTDYSAVSLKKYLKIQEDLETIKMIRKHKMRSYYITS